MFYEYLGEVFRSVFESEDGLWIVSYDHPREPRFVLHEEVRAMEKIEPPKDFLKQTEKNPTEGQKYREDLIRPLIINPECIVNRKVRRRMASAVSDENGTTIRRIQLLYYRHLAGRPLVEERVVTKKPESLQEKNFAWAIEEFYYSAKKVSLQTAYDLMLLARYVDAAGNKVTYCKRYGIDIGPEEWPSQNLPYEIITDKGSEFSGTRIMELVSKFGIDLQTLPPFRPDGKGLGEKCFDLIQERYKPLLRGKGVIEEDAQERWAVDYRCQAVLDLDEFTKIVIHCVLYLNHCRVLQNCAILANEADLVPSQLWKWYVNQDLNGMIPIGAETLYQMSLPRVTVTLTRKGINYKGLTYVTRDYEKLLEQYQIGSSVQIAYDTDDVSFVYLVLENQWKGFKLAKYCRTRAFPNQSTKCKRRGQRKKEKNYSIWKQKDV